MLSARVRLVLSALIMAAWVLLLFLGYALGGAAHLLLAASLALFPWREARSYRFS